MSQDARPQQPATEQPPPEPHPYYGPWQGQPVWTPYPQAGTLPFMQMQLETMRQQMQIMTVQNQALTAHNHSLALRLPQEPRPGVDALSHELARKTAECDDLQSQNATLLHESALLAAERDRLKLALMEKGRNLGDSMASQDSMRGIIKQLREKDQKNTEDNRFLTDQLFDAREEAKALRDQVDALNTRLATSQKLVAQHKRTIEANGKTIQALEQRLRAAPTPRDLDLRDAGCQCEPLAGTDVAVQQRQATEDAGCQCEPPGTPVEQRPVSPEPVEQRPESPAPVEVRQETPDPVEQDSDDDQPLMGAALASEEPQDTEAKRRAKNKAKKERSRANKAEKAENARKQAEAVEATKKKLEAEKEAEKEARNFAKTKRHWLIESFKCKECGARSKEKTSRALLCLECFCKNAKTGKMNTPEDLKFIANMERCLVERLQKAHPYLKYKSRANPDGSFSYFIHTVSNEQDSVEFETLLCILASIENDTYIIKCKDIIEKHVLQRTTAIHVECAED